MPSPDLDLHRPRAGGAVIADALRCYARDPGLFAALASLVVIPWGIVTWLVDGENLLAQNHRHGVHQLIELGVSLLIVGPLISALHVHAVAELGAGHRPRIGPVLVRGLRALAVVAAAEAVVALMTLVGFVCLIVPGVYLWARWAVVAQVAAMEDVNWIDALRLGWERTRGLALHVLGIIVPVSVVLLVLDRFVGLAIGSGDRAVSIIVAIAVQTVLVSVNALVTAIMYYDLRARSQSGARSASAD